LADDMERAFLHRIDLSDEMKRRLRSDFCIHLESIYVCYISSTKK
jgi:hypothetical protein